MSLHISASTIKDYLVCSRRVYYRLFQPERTLPSPEMLVGEIVHFALEKHWKSEKSAVDYINNNLDNLILRSRAVSFIKNYFDNFQFLVSDNDQIEKRFKIKIPNQSDAYLVGKIDRINNSSNTIIDWKTKKSPSSIDNDPQFMVYLIAYEYLYGNEPNSLLYVSLRDCKILRFKQDNNLMSILKNAIIPSLIGAIRNEKLVPTGLFDKKNCYLCNYKNACFEDNGYLSHELDHAVPNNEKG